MSLCAIIQPLNGGDQHAEASLVDIGTYPFLSSTSSPPFERLFDIGSCPLCSSSSSPPNDELSAASLYFSRLITDCARQMSSAMTPAPYVYAAHSSMPIPGDLDHYVRLIVAVAALGEWIPHDSPARPAFDRAYGLAQQLQTLLADEEQRLFTAHLLALLPAAQRTPSPVPRPQSTGVQTRSRFGTSPGAHYGSRPGSPRGRQY